MHLQLFKGSFWESCCFEFQVVCFAAQLEGEFSQRLGSRHGLVLTHSARTSLTRGGAVVLNSAFTFFKVL